MTDDIDTSAEAITGLLSRWEAEARAMDDRYPATKRLHRDIETLRAVAAERDALRAELASGSFYKESDIDALMARAEVAEAEVGRLREALEALRFEVLCIKRNRDGTLGMALDRADAALAASSRPDQST